jgi:hypothetical protein
MNRQPFSTAVAISVLLLCFLMTGTSYADTISFVTPVGATTSGGTVLSVADFVLGNNLISLTLTNLLQIAPIVMADPQLISGISFNITGAAGSGNLTTTNLGMISTISGSSYTAGVSNPLTGWTATETGNAINLNIFSGGKPNSQIIGPDSNGLFDPSLGGIYYVNSSITQHLPVVLGSATFNMIIPGVTASSQISNVTFLYGTNPSDTSNMVPGNLSIPPNPSVPEPSTILLLGTGLIGSGLVVRRQKNTIKALVRKPLKAQELPEDNDLFRK